MTKETIKEIGIDEEGKLFILPKESKFQYIYREAMGVKWNSGTSKVESPIPKEWSHLKWFEQITEACSNQGVDLEVTEETLWSNISSDLMEQINKLKQ